MLLEVLLVRFSSYFYNFLGHLMCILVYESESQESICFFTHPVIQDK